jgi:HlyD family secretion protein
MKRVIILIVAIAAIAGGTYYYKTRTGEKQGGTELEYDFDKIERKTVLNMVSATGTLAARDIIEVGTQVSGRLTQVLADFNDQVEEGQLIAMVDPSVLDITVKSEQADVMRMKAQLVKAVSDLERFKPVHEGGFLSDKELVQYEIAVQTAEANMLSSEAALERAKRNRSYAEIVAPISGIVIDRTVEPGQTVAASLNAPRLFTIANDLSKMEILANVDESDIGQILKGQEVRFTVATYLSDIFAGVVEEIRLSPKVQQSVVAYTVVVTADNPSGKLLPGMTATLDFVIEEVEDALSVPSGALNLKPNDAMLAAMEKMREARRVQREAGGGEGRVRPESGGGARPGGGGPGFGGPGGGGNSNAGILWYLKDGELAFMAVRKGVSDGVRTEIIPLRDQTIEEGMEIITKVKTASTSTASTQQQGGDGPGGGRGGLGRLGF